MNKTSKFDPSMLHHYLGIDPVKSGNSPILQQLESNPTQGYSNKTFHASGAMKIISKVKDLRTDRVIALAEMKKKQGVTDADIEQFLREARITAALEHPNIVPIHEISLNKGKEPYFTMKFMEDQSLKKILHELSKANPRYTAKYTLNTLLDIFLKTCSAISYAHYRRVIHLDIKPGNIMIGQHGETYICDWGLAKVMGNSTKELENIVPLDETILNDITLTGSIKGTPGFMAPEQIDSKFGKKDTRTDIYALGALLYTILTYKRPFTDLNSEQVLEATLHKRLSTPMRLSSKIPESLSAICMKAMNKEQAKRYQEVEEIVADVRAFQEGFVTQAENASALRVLLKLLQRNKLLTLMIGLAIATVVTIGTISGRLIAQKELTNMKKILKEKQKVEKLKTLLAEKEETIFAIDNSRLITSSSIRGQAIKLDGKNQGLQNPTLDLQQGTIVFWFKPHKTQHPFPKLFQLGDCKWYLNNASAAMSGGLISEGGYEEVRVNLIGSTLWDKWNHFAISWSKQGELKLFINGTKITLLKKHKTVKGFALGTWLNHTQGQSTNAYFDELSIWSKPLERSEVVELANRKLTKLEVKLKAYYSFDGDTTDSLSPDKTLQLIGAPTFLP